MTSTKPVLASTVRSFFQADEARMARLSPEAQHTVRVGALGRLHKEAIADFNKGRRGHRRYVVGATTAHKAQAEADAKAKRAALAAQGIAVGKRGPLPKAKPVAAQSKG